MPAHHPLPALLGSLTGNDTDNEDDDFVCDSPGHLMWDPFCSILTFIYVATIYLAAYQLRQILQAQHRVKTFQTGLLTLIVCFSTFRVIFWVKTMFSNCWSSSVVLFLFLFPNVLQFSIFSLLVVYYVQVVHKQKWKSSYRKTYSIIYGTFNCLFVLITIALCCAYSLDFAGDNATKILDDMYLSYLGVLDILLSTMIVIYGLKFERCLTYQKQLLPRSRKTFKLMNSIFVFVFFSRAIYAFLNIFKILPERNSIFDSNARHDPLFYGVFLFYFLTELVPVLVLVGLIWRVPKKQARSFSGNNKSATFQRHLQRGSTGQGFMSGSEEMSLAGESDVSEIDGGHNLPRDISKTSLRGMQEPLLSSSGGEGAVETPGSSGTTNIFQNANRYDSPPTGGFGSSLLGSHSDGIGEKFLVGSNTSSTDPQNNFSNIQASFGSDTISPYDILTNYTNRRQSSTRRQSGLGVDARPGSIGRTGTGGSRSSGNQNLSTSAPRELGSNSSLRPSSFTVNRSAIPPLP
eukprot:CAMPEP_0118659044 /NCGR_PEP_ID=MMETSP0785-20121206/14895_1 /TAXON_ID=91992 /ORGANISM="Bolidomonas pacifica, Strain CCMP 1866" /LENGTH=517 /DNA_ID=CAMNT_0006552109 /DNA_START=234 /DNA_END=1783 /DNA_ORIENTATION=+